MVRSAVLSALLCAAAACGGGSPASPSRDWIEIVGITPARGATLTATERVTFTVTASVTVAQTEGGSAVLVVSDHANRTLNNPAGPAASVRLTKGTQQVTLSDTITAPASGWTVNASAVLFVDGSNRTAMFQRVSYPVQ